ncbi:hypothetical protein AB6A40_011611 [Gnathostoma spinigerum]|uniref:Uncharacterized protein n=1 Tax=Gnathostoma spinigerum TaxID=75299 RepID=A0ABD6F493_9BILA
MRYAAFVFVVILAFANAKSIILSTCTPMNVPVLGKVGQASCVLSCKVQGCDTGSCQIREGGPMCVCSQCD